MLFSVLNILIYHVLLALVVLKLPNLISTRPPPRQVRLRFRFISLTLSSKEKTTGKKQEIVTLRGGKNHEPKKMLFDATLFYSPVFSKPAICNHGSDHTSEVTCHTKSVIYALPIGLVKHELLCKVQHQHR